MQDAATDITADNSCVAEPSPGSCYVAVMLYEGMHAFVLTLGNTYVSLLLVLFKYQIYVYGLVYGKIKM